MSEEAINIDSDYAVTVFKEVFNQLEVETLSKAELVKLFDTFKTVLNEVVI